MTFSCEGAVSKWIVGAEWVDGRTRYPEMQILRLIQPSGSLDTYEIVGRVELRITEEISNEVYEYTVVTPMLFRAGDVIGMFEPNSAVSHIQLYFKEGQGLTNYFAFGDVPFSPFTLNLRQDDVYPLIAVVIGKTRAHSTDIALLDIISIISTSQASSSPVTTGQAGPEGTATSQEVEPTSSKTTSQVVVSPTPTSTVQHSFLPITATTPAKTLHPSVSAEITGLCSSCKYNSRHYHH